LRRSHAVTLRLRRQETLQPPLRHVEQEDQPPIQDGSLDVFRMRSI
jgi:hypothetical protein